MVLWNIGHSDYKKGIDSVWLNKYPKNDAFLLIGSEIQGKITGPWNKGHNDPQKYEVTRSIKLMDGWMFELFIDAQPR